MFTRECAAILSRGGTDGVPAGGGNGCTSSQPPTCYVIAPQRLCEWKEGLSTCMEIFASLPLPWVKTQLKLHHFITVDISITILSCNSYNSPLPINPFASWHAACAIPHADPERAQAVLLTHALLMITNLAIFSPRPLQNKNPGTNLFQSNSPVMSIPYLIPAFSDI